MPVLPDVVHSDLASTLNQQTDYLQQFAGDISGAQQQAGLIGQYRLAAPHLPAGTYSALAAAGVDPTSQDFASIVQKYLPTTSSNVVDYLNGQVGSRPKTQTSSGNDLLVAAINPDGSFRFAKQGESGIALPNDIVGSLDPGLAQQYTSRQQQIKQSQSGGDGFNLNPFHDIAHAFSEGTSALEGGIKTGVRWTSGALYYPIEVGQNLWSHEFSALGDQPSGQVRGNDTSLADMLWRGTEFGQAVAHGGGKGWLLRPPPAAEAQKAQLQRGVRGYFLDQASGQPITASPGRGVAAAVGLRPQRLTTDPASLPFNLVSGGVDAFLDTKFDPAVPASQLWGDLRAARNGVHIAADDALIHSLNSGTIMDDASFNAAHEALTARETQMRSAGVIDGLRRWVHGPTYDQFANSSSGQRLFTNIANVDTVGELYDRTHGAWRNFPEVYQRLAQADTPEAVRQIFDDAVYAGHVNELPTNGLITGLGGARYALTGPLRDVRWAAMFPQRVINPDDPAQMLQTVDNYAKNANLSTDVRHALLDQAVNVAAANGVTRPNMLHGLLGQMGQSVYEKILGDSWWESPQGRQFGNGLAAIASNTPDTLRSEVANAIAHQFPNATLESGQLDEITNRIVGAPAVDRSATAIDAIRSAVPTLGKAYAPESLAWNLARYSRDTTAEYRQFLYDAAAPGGVPVLKVGDEAHAMDGPGLFGQLHHGEELLSDPRTIRRATSMFHNLYFGANPFMLENGTPRKWLDVLDAATHWYRTSTVLRPALALRQLISEQSALAASGHDNVFTNPLRTIAALIGTHGDTMSEFVGDHAGPILGPYLGAKVANVIDTPEAAARAQAIDLFTNKFADERQAMGRVLSAASGTDAAGNVRSDLAYASKVGTIAASDRAPFVNAWAYNVNQFNADPIARAIAQHALLASDEGAVPEAVAQSAADLWHRVSAGDLAQYRRELAGAGGWRSALLTPEGSRAYIDEISRQVDTVAGGQRDLLEAIATGKYHGNPIGDGKNADAGLTAALRQLRDQEIGPTALKGPLPVSAPTNAGSRLAAGRDHAVDWLFDHLITKPFEGVKDHAVGQFYNDGIEQILPLIDPAERAKIMDALLTGNTQQYATGATASGMIGAHEADLLAKQYAIQKLKGVALDLHERSQFGDMIRLLSPFADHWRQLVTKFAHLGVDNFPMAAQRFRQLHDWTENNGWFFNDQYGTLNFHVPLSGLAVGALTGDDQGGLVAPATGLSIATEGMPGIGGVLAVPAHMLLQAIPGARDIEQRLLPFGAPDTSNGILEAFAPRWAQKIITAIRAPEGQRDYAEQLAQTTAYLQARYPDKYTHDDEGHARLYGDAKTMTRELYVVRGIAQALTPAAPQVDQKVRSNDGSVEAWKIAADFRNMVDQSYAQGGTTSDAVTQFLTKYGENDALLMVPQSDSPIYGLGATQAMSDWKSANSTFARAYPQVWALFAPNANDQKNFSYYQYQRQLGDGERKLLSWNDRVALAEYRIASSVYDGARGQVGANPNRQQQTWLDGVRKILEGQYPGYAINNAQKPGPQKITGDYLVDRVATAANDPRLGSNLVADAIRSYMDARQQVLDSTNTLGEPEGLLSGTKLGSQQAQPGRAFLRGVGADLVKRVPSFAPTWDLVFSHEVQEP